MFANRAVAEPTRPIQILRKHVTDRNVLRIWGIDWEPLTMLRQFFLQRSQHDAALNRDRHVLWGQVDNTIHLSKIEHGNLACAAVLRGHEFGKFLGAMR